MLRHDAATTPPQPQPAAGHPSDHHTVPPGAPTADRPDVVHARLAALEARVAAFESAGASTAALVPLLTRIADALAPAGDPARRPPAGPGAGGLTVGQAALAAGVSPTTIRRAIRARDEGDRLPASDVGLGRRKPSWRIARADLDAWVRRRPGGTAPPARPMTRASPGKSRHFKF